jgi:hypothetical protein
MLRSLVWCKITDVSDVLAASIIALMMEAASTSEASINFNQIAWCNIPEDKKVMVFILSSW